MKRLLQYLIIFILIIFIIPAILTKRKGQDIQVDNPINENETIENQTSKEENNNQEIIERK